MLLKKNIYNYKREKGGNTIFFFVVYLEKMKIKLSSVLAGLVFSHTISAVVIKEEHLYKMQGNMSSSARYFSPISTTPPPASIFPTIAHPFLPVYADSSFNKVVPTCSWISNLFYPSVNNLAPTTPDPYILRLLDDFGGNPGLSISQPYDKVKINIIHKMYLYKQKNKPSFYFVGNRLLSSYE